MYIILRLSEKCQKFRILWEGDIFIFRVHEPILNQVKSAFKMLLFSAFQSMLKRKCYLSTDFNKVLELIFITIYIKKVSIKHDFLILLKYLRLTDNIFSKNYHYLENYSSLELLALPEY